MNKVTEIVTAWITSFNPTDEQKKLAEDRYSICLNCEFRKKRLNVEYCGKCGCPLSKKIFTQKAYDSCPMGKWKKVDDEYNKKFKKLDKIL
jgi:hypothetical protein